MGPEGTDRPYRFLILEDDLDRLNIMAKRLKRFFPGVELTHSTTADEFIFNASHNKFDAFFLDHDLGGEPPKGCTDPYWNTGTKAADWIYNNADESTKTIIHSSNPIGAARMRDIIRNNVMECGIVRFMGMGMDDIVKFITRKGE
jgi:hypothetical protein